MDRYEFCMQKNCPKFKMEETKCLQRAESAFDAASDMWDFVDKCCQSCEEMPDHLKVDFFAEIRKEFDGGKEEC